MQQIVRECTPHSVSARGWNYLREKGLHPQDVRSAYALLVAAVGEHKESVAQEKVTRKLRDALLSGEERGKAEMERRQKVHRLLRELQGRKRLQPLRDEKGSPLLESGSIARALKDFWGKIMGVQGEPPQAQSGRPSRCL